MILQRHEKLSSQLQNKVFDIVRAATKVDGINPLSEHVALHLRAGGDEADQHFTVLTDSGEIVGYAHLDETDSIAGPSAELVVAPLWRGQGIGRLLTEELLEVAGPRLRLWSHGVLPAGETLAKTLGFARVREICQMRRSLEFPIPNVQLPEAIVIEPFNPESDSDEWLDLNSRVFAGHPEQSSWTATDLELRMAEPWFDADGFLLARKGGRCVAFCWTKVHGEEASGHSHGHKPHHKHGHDPIGEIYVIGVDPNFQGQGLGRLLTLAGMNHLKDIGLRTVMLYVEGDNMPALKLYEELGFTRWGRDVMYRQDSVQTRNTGS
ncbi:MAG TPA: mycothiol synthase [Candidatus Nanopelagicaceae bacterium]|nr:mycothiol synthase [Candidatus Nanopelagicaceae bacterium]